MVPSVKIIAQDLKKPLKIKYAGGGEQGIDLGGNVSFCDGARAITCLRAIARSMPLETRMLCQRALLKHTIHGAYLLATLVQRYTLLLLAHALALVVTVQRRTLFLLAHALVRVVTVQRCTLFLLAHALVRVVTVQKCTLFLLATPLCVW